MNGWESGVDPASIADQFPRCASCGHLRGSHVPHKCGVVISLPGPPRRETVCGCPEFTGG